MTPRICPELGCNRPSRNGCEKRCFACYQKARRKKANCKAPDCIRKAAHRDIGYCRPHESLCFQNWGKDEHLAAWKRVAKSVRYKPDTGCWVWLERPSDEGRPMVHVPGTGASWLVYRFTYVWTYGGHDHGKVLDHLCSEAKCVNPRHVYPVTKRQNQRNGTTKGETPTGKEGKGKRGTDLEAWWCVKDVNGEILEGPPMTFRLGVICSLIGLNPKRWTPPGMVDEQEDPFPEITATD